MKQVTSAEDAEIVEIAVDPDTILQVNIIISDNIFYNIPPNRLLKRHLGRRQRKVNLRRQRLWRLFLILTPSSR